VKTLIRTILVLSVIAGGFLFTGCEREVGITASINWTDESYFTETGDWYAAAVVGLYSVVSGLENEPFEYVEVTPGVTDQVQFTGQSKGYKNFTVIIFLDSNGNGSYDAEGDILTGYHYETAEPGVELEITVNAYY
jgi:hypothetical protein